MEGTTGALRYVTAAYAFLLPSAYVLESVAGSANTILKPYRLLGVTLIVITLFRLLTPRFRIHLDRFDRGQLWIIGLAFVNFLLWKLLADEGSVEHWLNYTLLWLFGFSLCVIVKAQLRQDGSPGLVVAAFVAGLIASSLVASLDVRNTLFRFSGLIGNPNGYALAAGCTFHLLASRLLFGSWRRWYLQLVILAICGGLLMAQLLSGSRSGLAALAVSSLAWGIVILVKRHRSARLSHALRLAPLALVVAAGGVFALQFGSSYAIERYSKQYSVTDDIRIELWNATWDMAADHYMVGIGAGQTKHYMPAYGRRIDRLVNAEVVTSNLGAHNEFLRVLVEAGPVAFLLLLFLFAQTFRNLIQLLQSRENIPIWATAYPSITVFIVTFAAVGNTATNPTYWFFIAIVTAMAFSPRRPLHGLPLRRAARRRPPPIGRPPSRLGRWSSPV